ncbi:MAG: sodium/solute symporter [Bryobacterales bacterium]|nr:sodium/solute symporter [Bryobacterales bacterium]MDE0294990.1 sodium/solute symporter [Bryobacterales bacterium]
MHSLSFVDYLVIAVYLAGVAVIGLRAARRQDSTSEYFVANSSIPGFAVGFTLMTTTISSATFVAIPGSVFARNWWQLFYMSAALLVIPLVTSFAVPFYRRVVRMSVYEYLEHRFGYAARLYGSVGFAINRLTDVGYSLYTTAIAVEVIAGWNIHSVVVGVGIFTLLYTLIGGIEASIWTSILQGVLMIGGAVVIMISVITESGLGAGPIFSYAYDGGKFAIGNTDLSFKSVYYEEPTAWIYFFAGLTTFVRLYLTEQSMVQRYLVARSDDDAKRGAKLGILATVPTWFAFGVIGCALWSFYQLTPEELPANVTGQPDTILPYFIATHFPAGLIGLIMAALLSSSMSSVSADLNSIATVATKDHFVRLRPMASDAVQLIFGRFAVMVGGILCTAVALALTLTRSTASYEIAALLVSILAGGLLGLFALGVLSKRATRRGANAGIVATLVFVGWAPLTSTLGVDLGFNFEMTPMLIGLFSNVLIFVVGYSVSVLWGGPPPQLKGLTIWSMRLVGLDPKKKSGETAAAGQ